MFEARWLRSMEVVISHPSACAGNKPPANFSLVYPEGFRLRSQGILNSASYGTPRRLLPPLKTRLENQRRLHRRDLIGNEKQPKVSFCLLPDCSVDVVNLGHSGIPLNGPSFPQFSNKMPDHIPRQIHL
jgi:hypothetical protein